MDKPIEIILLPQAEEFIDVIEEPARKKLLHAMRKTKERFIGDWFKKLVGTDGLFEFRIENMGKCYRLFTFWDSRGNNQTLIVGTHGLIKKTNKTPKSEIEKAKDIKDRYFKGLI
jgi:phage-related protein